MSTEIKPSSSVQASAEKAEKNEQRPAIAPSVDVYENENELLVVADLPGVTQDRMNIHFEKGRLTIEGRRSAPAWTSRLAEAHVADFRRTFLIPQGIDAERITAELAQGVLSVHLPKHSSLKPRRIEIKAA
jgi:HSP20 family molecular chaperone IbpA